MPRPRTLLAALTASLAVAACTAAPAGATSARAHPASAHPAHPCSPRVSIDAYSDRFDKTDLGGTFVGNLSALAPDPRTGALLALSDRSQLFALDGRTHTPRTVIRLADEAGLDLDSEGLAVERDGTRLVASETEPSVRRYAPDGTLLGSLPVPAALRVAPEGRATRNATFEGLTLTHHGRGLLAAMEAPLSGDTGVVRLQTWRKVKGPHGNFALSAQYAYRPDPGLGVSETTALPDGRLLVLERGFTAGYGNTVRLYAADTRRAEDVSGVQTLAATDPHRRFVAKTLLTDLADCPSLGAPARQPQPNPLLDNIEGMAVTGRAPGGRIRVVLVSDDNQSAAQITRLYQFRVRLPQRH
ncbi:esterase-like activity of phytase family protein [Streptomyces sp. NPDC050504]|uniref:esterase-like activity of phytase family protein n=1 Tax=Streptomyces sp. NPDC050504 TaxID=3365618 RepID=UPI003788B5F0